MFTKSFAIKFSQCDPAGILFFARIFEITHDLYEEWIHQIDISYQDWFQSKDWAIPIRRCEANYLKPMFAGQTYEIQLQAERLGKTSFTLKWIYKKEEKVHCEVLTTHVFLNKKTQQSMKIPDKFRKNLN